MQGFGFGRGRGAGALVLAGLVWSGAAPGGAWGQAEVTGSVTDQDSGAPLAAVLVEVLDATGAVVARATTGPAGAYEIGDVAPGTYAFQFSSPGWTTARLPSESVAAGQSTTASTTMTAERFELNPITVTVSRASEKVLDAPAAVEVVSLRDLEARQVTSPAEHVEHQPGVDVARTGIRGRYAVLRGFNNVFSGRSLYMTDNRIARVPSLRANIFYLNPTSELDLERVETVLGPASALYGPNAANGVIHYITKSPIRSPGVNFSMGGGLRQQGDDPGIGSLPIQGETAGLTQFDGRIALAPSEEFGFKLSGQWFEATEYVFDDIVEADVRDAGRSCIGTAFDLTDEACQAFDAGLDLMNPADQDLLARSVRNAESGRSPKHRNWALDARMDFEPQPGTSLVLSAGRNVGVDGTNLTGLGAARVDNWAVSYGQARLRHRDLFAQVFYNWNSNDQTFLLRSGRPLIDHSALLVGQVQYQSRIGSAHRLIYGADYLRTNPDTEGTINGAFEGSDETTELGGYAQWEWSMGGGFNFTGAFRYDHNTNLPDPVFSPRAALVYKPDQAHSFRLTFNRAFSTPTSTNQFLDISGGTLPLPGLPFLYDLRATGAGSNGYTYMRDPNGIPMHMSPFNVLLGGSARDFLPSTTAQLWAEAVALLAASDPQLGALVGAIAAPTPEQVGVVALLLDTETAGGGTPPPGCVAAPFCQVVDLAAIRDIDPLDATVSNTLELGYKGLFGDRLALSVNGWYTRYDSYTSSLRLVSPNVFLNGAQVQAYLTGAFRQMVGVAFPNEVIADLTAETLAGLAGQIPLGSVVPTSAGGTKATVALAYQTVGGFDVMGGELGAGLLLSDELEMTASLSLINRNAFETSGELVRVVSLNSPTVRATTSLTYRNEESGFNGGLRFRGQNGFPFDSGPWVGDLDGVTTLDANLGFRIPGNSGLWFQLDVSNLFNNEYQSMTGAPAIGRVLLTRIRWDFNPF